MADLLSVSSYSIKSYLVFLLFMGSLMTACSDNPFSYQTDDIAVRVTSEGLEVLNKMDRPVYYFGVEQGTAAVILWAPISRPENQIKPRRKKAILFSEIAGYKNNSKVIFNYWTSENPEVEVEVRNIVVSTSSE